MEYYCLWKSAGNYQILFMNIALCSIGFFGLKFCAVGRIIALAENATSHLDGLLGSNASLRIVVTGIVDGMLDNRS
jgi:hypothetical protein